MTLKHTTKHMEGYMPVVEAADGEGLSVGWPQDRLWTGIREVL
jgi:hypothetical protein